MRLTSAILLGSLVLVGGCGSPSTTSATSPSANGSAVSPSSSSAPAKPQCTVASSAAIAALDAAVRAKGQGNSLPTAVAWADPQAKAWWLVGALAGPAGAGDGALGIWSTTSDPTEASFTGPVFAVDGGANSFSTAPPNTVVVHDPTNVPALGCWSDKGTS